jgi:hypothetical protein
MYRDEIGGDRHREIRGVLRFIGPLVLLVGLGFTIVGFGSFFLSFGSFEPPRYFWCAFVGLPLLAIGGGITKFAYMGAVGRYVAGEAAPVAKDTFNYLADGTSPGVKSLARAVGEGLAGAGGRSEPQAVLRCHKCNAENDADARFCDNCGAPLAKTKPCSACDELNDPDARFCDNCGAAFPGD